MRSIPYLAKSANQKIEGRPAQYNLPPAALPWRGDRKRRERTDADRDWYAKQLAVQHVKLIDKSVFERVAYYGSLNPERLAFPSVARVAHEVLCSARTVQRALRRLEVGGLIKCVSRVGGRATAQYLVVGRSATLGVAGWRAWGDKTSPEVLREGITQVQRSLKNGDSTESPGDSSESPVTDGAQTIDPSENASAQTIDPPEKAVQDRNFPSQEQKQEKAKAPVPKKQGPTSDPKQVDKYFKLLRKLNYEVNDELGIAFEKLPHHLDRKAILDGLEAEERDLAHQGKLSFAPVAMPKRLGEVSAKTVTAAFESRHSAACSHVPAKDLPINCGKCGAYIGGT